MVRRTRHSKAAAAVGLLAAFGLGTSTALAAETKGPVTDEIAVIKVAPGDPIQIGVYVTLSGPDSAIGIDEFRGIEIAVDDKGGMLLGHPIRVHEEDAACTAEGGQTAATKLAANQKIVVVIGAMCSSETVPGAPILWKAGIPSVGISPTAPNLTDPNRDEGFHGFIRTVWNDLWAGSETAQWAYEVEGARRTAAIHDGSPYAQQLAQVYADTFAELGGEVTSIEAVSPTDTDMHPMLTKIASDNPDFIFAPVFVQAAGHIVRQAREVSGLENTRILGSDASLSPLILELAGEAVTNFSVTSNDLSAESLGSGYPKFLEQYKAKYGEKPTGGFHHFGYDAANTAMAAVEKVAVKDDDGNTYIGRMAVRNALFATKGLKGLTGDKTCNEHGDCGTFNYTVYSFVSSTDEFELGKNPKKTYPAN